MRVHAHIPLWLWLVGAFLMVLAAPIALLVIVPIALYRWNLSRPEPYRPAYVIQPNCTACGSPWSEHRYISSVYGPLACPAPKPAPIPAVEPVSIPFQSPVEFMATAGGPPWGPAPRPAGV